MRILVHVRVRGELPSLDSRDTFACPCGSDLNCRSEQIRRRKIPRYFPPTNLFAPTIKIRPARAGKSVAAVQARKLSPNPNMNQYSHGDGFENCGSKREPKAIVLSAYQVI